MGSESLAAAETTELFHSDPSFPRLSLASPPPPLLLAELDKPASVSFPAVFVLVGANGAQANTKAVRRGGERSLLSVMEAITVHKETLQKREKSAHVMKDMRRKAANRIKQRPSDSRSRLGTLLWS